MIWFELQFRKVPVTQKKEQQITERQLLHVAAGREEVNWNCRNLL